MQENVVDGAHLIHNSMSELNRAINAAHTTLHNSINAFNALNFNKFLENVYLFDWHNTFYRLLRRVMNRITNKKSKSKILHLGI